ncbi:MAG: peroxiredoxin family protein [Bacteroidales bacterium]|nr:peroxiredoxin family protein [Bacteroidales bacterium]
MKKISIVLLIVIFGIQNAFSQNVVITGNAKTYAGDVLQWRGYTNQITFHEKVLAECKVDAKGNFRFEINIKKPELSFIHLSVFKGILYIQPGKNYQIVLPQKQEKSKADELNPFFKETEFFVRCVEVDSTDLNVKIKYFDKLLDSYMAESFKQFKGKVSKNTVDSIIDLIEKEFPGKQNEYFANYRKYNYAAYRLIAYERNKEKFIENNFLNKPILWNNPAYMDLFNRIFNNYLKILYRDPKGKAIPYNLIKRKSLTGLKSCLDSFPYLQNDTLKDLVILKSLYDNFYKDDFPHASILFMIDSVQYSTDVPEIELISDNIKQKLTTLLLNYPAPDFKLKNVKGKEISLSDYRGSFVCLNFCTPFL